MASWWDSSTIFVEIAFDDPPLTATASCTWTDVTAYVRGVSINRGRTTELSTYAPGTATVQLDNLTRLFDPSNSAGTYYGKLLPMKRIRVRAAIGVTSATVFAGYVLGWPISYPGMTDSVVSVACVDGTRILEQSIQPGSAYGAAVLADSPSYYWPMQSVDDDGILLAEVGGYDLSPSVTLTSENDGFSVENSPEFPLGEDNAAYSGRGVASISSLSLPSTVEFWAFETSSLDTSHGLQIRFATSTTNYFVVVVPPAAETVRRNSVTVYYSNSGSSKQISAAGFTQYDDVLPMYGTRHIAVTADGTNVKLYVNGTLLATTALVAGTTVISSFTGHVPGVSITAQDTTGGNAVSHVAAYSTALAAADILEHYNAGVSGWGHPWGEGSGTRVGRVLDSIGWPSADRSLSTGTTIVGPWYPEGNSALTACRSLESTEQGSLFIGADGNVVFRDRQWIMTNSSSATSTATFGDSGSEIPYTDVTIDGNLADYIRNRVSVNYGSGTVTAKDDTSITAYGEQSDSATAADLPAAQGSWLGRQLAAYRLRLRKDPATRVPAISIAWRKNLATYLPTRLNMELGERVTVKRRPTGGTGSFDLACTVQGIRDDITPSNWTTTLYLSPATDSYTEAPYLTLGDATYGKIGAVAGNTIPY